MLLRQKLVPFCQYILTQLFSKYLRPVFPLIFIIWPSVLTNVKDVVRHINLVRSWPELKRFTQTSGEASSVGMQEEAYLKKYQKLSF
jgi:hypothetical protein